MQNECTSNDIIPSIILDDDSLAYSAKDINVMIRYDVIVGIDRSNADKFVITWKREDEIESFDMSLSHLDPKFIEMTINKITKESSMKSLDLSKNIFRYQNESTSSDIVPSIILDDDCLAYCAKDINVMIRYDVIEGIDRSNADKLVITWRREDEIESFDMSLNHLDPKFIEMTINKITKESSMKSLDLSKNVFRCSAGVSILFVFLGIISLILGLTGAKLTFITIGMLFIACGCSSLLRDLVVFKENSLRFYAAIHKHDGRLFVFNPKFEVKIEIPYKKMRNIRCLSTNESIITWINNGKQDYAHLKLNNTVSKHRSVIVRKIENKIRENKGEKFEIPHKEYMSKPEKINTKTKLKDMILFSGLFSSICLLAIFSRPVFYLSGGYLFLCFGALTLIVAGLWRRNIIVLYKDYFISTDTPSNNKVTINYKDVIDIDDTDSEIIKIRYLKGGEENIYNMPLTALELYKRYLAVEKIKAAVKSSNFHNLI